MLTVATLTVFVTFKRFNLYLPLFHSATVAVCRNYLEKNCSFTADACWWNHKERENASGVMCFICSEVFETRSEMMKHRKTNHANIVQQCSKFVEGNCQFQENSVGSNILKKSMKKMMMAWKKKKKLKISRFFRMPGKIQSLP